MKSGDVHIAYQVMAEGALDLVLVPGFVSNVEYIWGRGRATAWSTRRIRLRPEELAALVKHALLDHLVRAQEQRLWDGDA